MQRTRNNIIILVILKYLYLYMLYMYKYHDIILPSPTYRQFPELPWVNWWGFPSSSLRVGHSGKLMWALSSGGERATQLMNHLTTHNREVDAGEKERERKKYMTSIIHILSLQPLRACTLRHMYIVIHVLLGIRIRRILPRQRVRLRIIIAQQDWKHPNNYPALRGRKRG